MTNHSPSNFPLKRWTSVPELDGSTKNDEKPLLKLILPARSGLAEETDELSSNQGEISKDTSPSCSSVVEKSIQRLRKESSIPHCIANDYAEEKFLLTSALVATNWADFSISSDQADMASTAGGSGSDRKRAKSVCDPVHITTTTAFCAFSNSPSPTLMEKQCYSPSMQRIVKEAYFSPSPSPSPTRRSFVRSLSPIAAKSRTVYKRKHDSDGECSNGAKRCFISLFHEESNSSSNNTSFNYTRSMSFNSPASVSSATTTGSSSVDNNSNSYSNNNNQAYFGNRANSLTENSGIAIGCCNNERNCNYRSGFQPLPFVVNNRIIQNEPIEEVPISESTCQDSNID